METLLSNINHFTNDQQQLIMLIHSCPLRKPSDKCILLQTRKEFKKDYKKAIDSFEIEEIPELLAEHQKCLINRAKKIDLLLKKERKFNSRTVYLRWTGKGNMVFLIFELKKRKWIKTDSNFSDLFENTNEKRKVYWNMQFKYELAYLLYRLKEEGFIYPVNSKGYFKYIEEHVNDCSKKSLPKNTLKFINHKILNNREKYADVINEVEAIMKFITI